MTKIKYNRLLELYNNDSSKYRELLNSYIYTEVENNFKPNPDVLNFVKNKNNSDKNIDKLYTCKKSKLSKDEKIRCDNIVKLNGDIFYLSDFIKRFFTITRGKSITEKVTKIKEKMIIADSIILSLENNNCLHDSFLEILLDLQEIKNSYPDSGLNFVDRINWIKDEQELRRQLELLRESKPPQIKYKFIDDVINGYETPEILNDENKGVVSLFTYWNENKCIDNLFKTNKGKISLDYCMIQNSFKKEYGKQWEQRGLENAKRTVKTDRKRIEVFERVLKK